MFKSNKNKLESLEDCIDGIKEYIDVVARDIQAFKREIRNDFFDLKSKHDAAVEAGEVAVEQMGYEIGNLRDRCEQLNKWDDETRSKFRALLNHFEISFTDGRRVVERESED